MALRYVTVSGANAVSESLNNQSTLTTAVSTAITAAGTANAAAGAKADVTTELAAITTALTNLTANRPSGDVVVVVDTSAITTRNQLKARLDAAYAHLVASNIVT